MDYLMHHGIRGQKWGVKNGPPYPLDSSQKSASEKKYRVSRITSDLSEASKKFNKAYNKTIKSEDFSWDVDHVIDAMSFYDKKSVIDHGANFVADLITTKQKLGRFDEIIDPESKLPKKKSQTTPEEDCQKVNPTGINTLAYRLSPYINCTMCATAFELRRRGYDVMAKQKASPEELVLSMTLSDMYFSGKTHIYFPPTYNDFMLSISDIEKTSKDGDRGFIDFYYKNSNDGHVLNYEIKNHNMMLYDSQSGDVLNPHAYFRDLAGSKKPGNIFRDYRIVRDTQNLKPDYGAIRLLAIE